MKHFNKIKFINIITIITFISALTLPLIIANKKPNTVSPTENRYLANLPSLFDENGNFSASKFVSDFQKWLTDNVGFRNEASDIFTEIYYKIWKESLPNNVLLGKNEWLYYYNNDTLLDYSNSIIPDEKMLQRYSQNFEKVTSVAKKYNIPIINLLLPDKKTVYPENFPDNIKKVSDKSISDYLIEYLKGKNIDILYPLQSLVDGKSIGDTYSPRIDTSHYNMLGAFIAYTEVMKKIKEFIPNLKIDTMEDYNITNLKLESKLNNVVPISEITKNFELKSVETTKYIPNYFDNKPTDAKRKTDYRKYENEDKSLPKILIIGDSYIFNDKLMIKFLKNNFSSLTFLHNYSGENYVEKYIQIEKPDIILYETVERMLFKKLK